MTKSELVRKGLFCFIAHKSVSDGSKRQESSVETDAENKDNCHIFANSPWLAQLAFSHIPGSLVQGLHTYSGLAPLNKSLVKKMPPDMPTGQSAVIC